MKRISWMWLAAPAAAVLMACGQKDASTTATTADSTKLTSLKTDSTDSVKVRRAPRVVDLNAVIDRPVAVYVEASSDEIDASRASASTQDFAVSADDLMFYRSAATEYLDTHGIPYQRITGRRPLRFMVAGEVQEFDFADVGLLDFLVIYDGRGSPRILAPNDISESMVPPPPSPPLGRDTILITDSIANHQ
jgi:hypothetical protein